MVVSAFTEGTPYESEAMRLRASLDRFGIPSLIRPFPDMGDWHANVFSKVSILNHVALEYSGPFMWIDADAFVHYDFREHLMNLMGSTDFGAHWFQGPKGGYDYSRNDNWFLAGTLVFSGSPQSKELIGYWYRLSDPRGKGSGQETLRKIIEESDFSIEVDGMLTTRKLPARYTYIFDKSMHVTPDEPNWIEHTIASRENKDASKGKVNDARQKRLAELDAILKKG